MVRYVVVISRPKLQINIWMLVSEWKWWKGTKRRSSLIRLSPANLNYPLKKTLIIMALQWQRLCITWYIQFLDSFNHTQLFYLSLQSFYFNFCHSYPQQVRMVNLNSVLSDFSIFWNHTQDLLVEQLIYIYIF